MAIVKCTHGHYHDNAKFAECPYCKKVEDEKNRFTDRLRDSVTVSMTARDIRPEAESVTIGLHEPVKGDEQKTVGIFSKNKGNGFVTGWLVCIEGREKGRDYRLQSGFNRIGRSFQMDVCIMDDAGISRDSHASIVYDYKSMNFYLIPGSGTISLLNDKIVTESIALSPRDIISMGESRFEFIPFCKEGHIWEKEN